MNKCNEERFLIHHFHEFLWENKKLYHFQQTSIISVPLEKQPFAMYASVLTPKGSEYKYNTNDGSNFQLRADISSTNHQTI